MTQILLPSNQDPSADTSLETAKFKFGPRVVRNRSKVDSEVNSSNQNAPEMEGAGCWDNGRNQVTSNELATDNIAPKYVTTASPGSAVIDFAGDSSLSAPNIIAVLREQLAELEKERNQLRARVAVLEKEGTLDSMVIEIELETLRDEVARLKGLVAVPTVESPMDNLRERVIELESLVSTLRKDKISAESKYLSLRNADLARIRTLEEQVVNEKRMRDRMAATEFPLPVVAVPSSGATVILRPRALKDEATSIPTFTAEGVAASLTVPTVKYPDIVSSDLGSDEMALQWKLALSGKPEAVAQLVSRVEGTNNFIFGTKQVSCRKLGNVVMVQLGNETRVLERFIDMYWEDEIPSKRSTISQPSTTVVVPSLTLKGLKAKAAQQPRK